MRLLNTKMKIVSAENLAKLLLPIKWSIKNCKPQAKGHKCKSSQEAKVAS